MAKNIIEEKNVEKMPKYKYFYNSEHCIHCGDVIPEGGLVCMNCKSEVKSK